MLIEEITANTPIEKQLFDCYQQNEWRPHELDEAQDFDVRFLDSPMFDETFKQKIIVLKIYVRLLVIFLFNIKCIFLLK
jgi:hypothetical protein